MNQRDEYAALRIAFASGARIQAWHLNAGAKHSSDGRWDTLSTYGEPAFSCPVHLYRIHPDDELKAAGVILETQIAALDTH